MFTSTRHTVTLVDILNDDKAKAKLESALSTYPIYTPKTEDEELLQLIPTRETLNKKLFQHYKYREISAETVGRFIDEFAIVMDEIMPYYNQMFKSVETMFTLDNPFDSVDMVETYEEEKTDKSISSGQSSTQSSDTSNSNSNVKFSDTPQNNLSNIDNYLTTYSEDEGSANSSGSSSAESSGVVDNVSKVKHTHTRKGSQGVTTYAHDMLEFRQTIIDVTMQIITDKRIAELFLLVW